MRVKQVVYRSDRGKTRRKNHDAVMSLGKIPLFAVADGDGGSEAAHTVLTTLKEQARGLAAKNRAVVKSGNTASRLAIGRYFEVSLQAAGDSIREANDADPKRRLASTVVAATVVGPYAFVAHVGDSRAYLLRAGELRCMTNDHTLAMLQLRRGDITPAEFATSPFRNTLSQALGVTPALEVDLAELRLMGGDLLLLCSNGLTRVLSNPQLTEAIDPDDLEGSANNLLAAAHKGGAPDNVSFVMALIEAEPTAPASSVDLEAVVRQAFLYRDLEPPDWASVTPYLERAEYGTGDTISTATGVGDTFYVIARGSALVRRNAAEKSEVGVGGHFGQLALAVDNAPREAANALEPTTVFALTRERFAQLARKQPALGIRLTMSLLESLGAELGTLSSRLSLIEQAVHGPRTGRK